MRALSNQGQVTFVIEGAPLHSELNGVPATALKQAIPADKPIAFDTALVKIVAAYDYEPERVDDHLYLLRKRYSDPMDLPLVTFGEIVHALEQMLVVTRSYYVPKPGQQKSAWAIQFLDSLSPGHSTQVTTSLPVSSLTATQYRLAYSEASQQVFRYPVTEIERTLRQLRLLHDAHTQFTSAVVERASILAYREPPGTDRVLPVHPLTVHVSMRSSSGDRTTVATDLSAIAPVTAEDRRLAQGMLANALPETVTLGEAVTRNALGVFAGESSDITVSVDPALVPKPVTILGRRFSTRLAFLHALAALYDIPLAAMERHTLHFALPVARPTKNMDEASEELYRLTPPALRKVVTGQRTYPAYPKTGEVPIYSRSDFWFAATIRRILARVLTADGSTSPPNASIVSTGEESVRLLALVLFTSPCLEAVDYMINRYYGSVDYLTSTDPSYVYIKYMPGRSLEVWFGKRNKNGAGGAMGQTYDLTKPDPLLF